MSRSILPFVLLAVTALCAQSTVQPKAADSDHASDVGDFSRPLTWKEGRQIVQMAWQSRSQTDPAIDCSHLVHDVYESAGLHYPYATSNELYAGVDGFKRVRVPQPADLIVWPGHVGIVVDPQQRSFYSSLNSGLKIDSYDAAAWRARGPAHFFRYLLHQGESVVAPKNRNVQTADLSGDDNAPATAVGSSKAVPDIPDPPSRVGIATLHDEIFLKGERPVGKNTIHEALLKAWNNVSEERQDRWDDAQRLTIVETLKVERVRLNGGSGVVEVRIKSAARMRPDGLDTRAATESLNFHLKREKQGWRLEDSSGRMYLAGNAAVAAVSERLAGLARENASRADQAQAAALLHSLVH
jgi:hypothetical protein